MALLCFYAKLSDIPTKYYNIKKIYLNNGVKDKWYWKTIDYINYKIDKKEKIIVLWCIVYLT